MNSHSKELLRDLLEEDAPSDFQAVLLTETLRHARRRRRIRSLNRALATVAFAVGFSILLWRIFVFRSPLPQPAQVQVRPIVQTRYGLVSSRPLDPALVIETKTGAVNILSSVPETVAIVETNPDQPLYKELADD